MIYGGITSQEPNMIEKSLPIAVAPIEGECLKTFLMRAANVYGVSSERFIEHCFRIQGQGRRTLPYGTIDTLTTRLNKNLIHPLSSALSVSNLTLRQLTIAGRFPSASSGLIAFTGASKCLDKGEETLNHQLRFGWCPLCLMEDRAEAEHHHLPQSGLLLSLRCARPTNGR